MNGILDFIMEHVKAVASGAGAALGILLMIYLIGEEGGKKGD